MTPIADGRTCISRRGFLCCAAALLALPAAGPASGWRSRSLRAVFATDGADPEVLRGVRFGAAEMQHTARLLRSSFELVEVRAAEAAARAQGEGVHVIVCGASPVAAELARTDGVLVVDAAARAGAASCAGVLRLGIMAAEADVLSDGDVVEIWHPSLFRFGAAQLNERYERAQGVGMTSGAWCGWMAVKAAWEAAQRTDGSAAAMRAYLASAETRLDGHKGEALHFDARTGWLVQPLYRVQEGAVKADIASAEAAAVVRAEASCA